MTERKPVWVLFPRYCRDTKRWKRGNIFIESYPPYGNSGDGYTYWYFENAV